MKKSYKILIFIFGVLLLLLFTPLNLSQFMLTPAQRQSLCESLVELDSLGWGEAEFKNSAVISSMKIFGISGMGKHKTVYGYLYDGLYVEVQEKGYDVSGSLAEFMVDIEVDGDEVSIIKKYGDNVSTASTLEEMPLRYRCKWQIYVGLELDQQLLNKANRRVKKTLGVPADTVNTLSIDDENGTYEIYDIKQDGKINVVYSGKIDELYK